MIRRLFAPLLAAFVLGSPALAEAPTALGSFRDWDAFKRTQGSEIACYAVSSPTDKAPKNVNRDPAFFMVTNWQGRPADAEPSIIIGYPFRDGSTATVTVGSAKFDFFTKGDGAWLADPSDEKRLINAMKGGTSLIVKGTSSRGTLTTDKYSLLGISAALDKIGEACK